MKSKILSIVLLILLVASLSLGYRIGYRNARKGVAFLAVDTKDTLQGPVKEESDPYFTKCNPMPDQIKDGSRRAEDAVKNPAGLN